MAGPRPSLEDATCERTPCSDGTLLEMVRFRKHIEELDKFVQSFPVKTI